jgi:hypothetical protein
MQVGIDVLEQTGASIFTVTELLPDRDIISRRKWASKECGQSERRKGKKL